MLTNPPIPYDLCVGVPILHHQLTVGLHLNSVLNVKALVGAVNQEKALVVGAFSVIPKLWMDFRFKLYLDSCTSRLNRLSLMSLKPRRNLLDITE